MEDENFDHIPLIFRPIITCTLGFSNLSGRKFSTIEKEWLISQIGLDLSCLDIICNRYRLSEMTKKELRNIILDNNFPFLDAS